MNLVGSISSAQLFYVTCGVQDLILATRLCAVVLDGHLIDRAD